MEYADQTGGTTSPRGNVSGYASTYDVAFDEKGNVYSQSHFGWTVEKWKYNGSLPVITPTGVETVEGELPESFSLAQNYPNPFNPSTTIEFTVLTSGNVKLAVYDVLGRHVQTLVDNVSEPGVFRVSFDARALPGGTPLRDPPARRRDAHRSRPGGDRAALGASAHRQLQVHDQALREGVTQEEALRAVVHWLVTETAR